MKRLMVFSILAFFLAAALAVPGRADVSLGATLTDEGLKSFYVAIGEHYKVKEEQVVVVKKRSIPDEELPVVFFLASRAGVSADAIIKLRLGGDSWMQITAHYGLNPEIYYVPVARKHGPPYGNAYGHFKNRERKQWGDIRLSDDEIVNFVNLKFVSEHYGYSPDEVIDMRSKGKDFISINAEVKSKAKGKSQPMASQDGAGKGKSKDKDKGNGKKNK